jgi:hypothetical protein
MGLTRILSLQNCSKHQPGRKIQQNIGDPVSLLGLTPSCRVFLEQLTETPCFYATQRFIIIFTEV